VAYRLHTSASVKNVLGQPTHSEIKNQRQQELTRHILAYWIEHPDAKDTAEGIFNWWFRAYEPRWRMDEVKAVLDDLTARGWLTRRRMRQSEVIYGLIKETITEIKTFLTASFTE
jgi:hypothetical protein